MYQVFYLQGGAELYVKNVMADRGNLNKKVSYRNMVEEMKH